LKAVSSAHKSLDAGAVLEFIPRYCDNLDILQDASHIPNGHQYDKYRIDVFKLANRVQHKM